MSSTTSSTPAIGGPVGGTDLSSGVGISSHYSSSIWNSHREGHGAVIRRLSEHDAEALAENWDEVEAERPRKRQRVVQQEQQQQQQHEEYEVIIGQQRQVEDDEDDEDEELLPTPDADEIASIWRALAAQRAAREAIHNRTPSEAEDAAFGSRAATPVCAFLYDFDVAGAGPGYDSDGVTLVDGSDCWDSSDLEDDGFEDDEFEEVEDDDNGDSPPTWPREMVQMGNAGAPCRGGSPSAGAANDTGGHGTTAPGATATRNSPTRGEHSRQLVREREKDVEIVRDSKLGGKEEVGVSLAGWRGYR